MRPFVPALIIAILLTATTRALPQTASQSGQSPEPRYTEIRATVIRVIRLTYPYAILDLRVQSSSDPNILSVPAQTISATTYFWGTGQRPDCYDRRNLGSLTGYYLLQGDEIHAKLFFGFKTVGRQPDCFIYGISRMPKSTQGAPENEMSSLALSLSCDKSLYKSGEPVSMTLTVRNQGSMAETLYFRSGQQYDFVVSQAGNEIWRWSSGKAFTMALTSRTIAPGETVRYGASWNQTDRGKKRVSPGEYEIAGVLRATDEGLPTAEPVKVIIRP